MERHTPESVYELLQRDHYTPEEVADLLGIGLDAVRHAAFTGDLRATIVEHDIIRLSRDDVVAWFAERDRANRGDRDAGG
jgi:excisionase family DNA binding protein